MTASVASAAPASGASAASGEASKAAADGAKDATKSAATADDAKESKSDAPKEKPPDAAKVFDKSIFDCVKEADACVGIKYGDGYIPLNEDYMMVEVDEALLKVIEASANKSAGQKKGGAGESVDEPDNSIDEEEPLPMYLKSASADDQALLVTEDKEYQITALANSNSQLLVQSVIVQVGGSQNYPNPDTLSLRLIDVVDDVQSNVIRLYIIISERT